MHDGARRILIGETLSWKHDPVGKKDWQLFHKESAMAKICIPWRSPASWGTFQGNEFTIEEVKRGWRRTPMYVIRIRKKKDVEGLSGFAEWGHLEFDRDYQRIFHPIRLVVNDFGVYTMICNDSIDAKYVRELLIISSNREETGRMIGVTRQPKGREDHCTFTILSIQPRDPPIMLMAAINFYMLFRISVEANNFGFFDWNPFQGN